jgi:nicotinate-nucleotide pyrophosphorylase (carboxylating)
VEGDAAAILTGERTALNLLGRLSGVATLTHRYVAAVAGTGTRILDTRKTTPGCGCWRRRRCAGGGGNQRVGLYDALLIKENHAAMAGASGRPSGRAARAFPTSRSRSSAARSRRSTRRWRRAPRGSCWTTWIRGLRAAVDRIAGRAEAEGSGGMDLATVRAAAEAGLDSISVGALTHSAPVLDLSLLLEPLP